MAGVAEVKVIFLVNPPLPVSFQDRVDFSLRSIAGRSKGIKGAPVPFFFWGGGMRECSCAVWSGEQKSWRPSGQLTSWQLLERFGKVSGLQ